MNDIQTWQRGCFVDGPQYRGWSEEDKRLADEDEHKLVRPHPTGNAICRCNNPSDAAWVARRLNLASILEQMTYDYATGKTDGSEIVKLIYDYVNS